MKTFVTTTKQLINQPTNQHDVTKFGSLGREKEKQLV